MSISSGNSPLKRTEATNFNTDAVDCFPDNVPVSGLCDSRSVFVRATSPVVRLRNHINPLHIIWGIWAVIFSAVYGKSGRPLADVVCVEIGKRIQPTGAHRNSSPTVVLEALVFRVCAAIHHCAMNGVKRVFGAPRNIGILGSFFVAFGGLFVLPAAAGNNVSATEIFAPRMMLVPTITDTIPLCPTGSLKVPVRAQSNKPTETLAGDINSELLCGSGRHDISNLGNGMSGLYHGADAPEYKFWMNPDDVYEGSLAVQFSGRLKIGG